MTDLATSEQPEQQPFAFTDRVWPHDWMGPFLEALSLMPVVTQACEIASVSVSWAYDCAKLHPEFKEGWAEALARAPDRVEGVAWKWATEGMPVKTTRTKSVIDENGERTVIEETVEETVVMSPSLLKFVLAKFVPAYNPSIRHQHIGATGGAIEHAHRHEVERVPDDQRVIELARLYAEFGTPELPAGEPAVIEHKPVEK